METASVVNSSEKTRAMSRHLVFSLGNTAYGIPVEHVREVVEYSPVFKIPRVPDYIHGIINIRGEVIPVIDLACYLYGEKGTLLSSTAIVFIETDYMDETVVLGVMIDSVEEVADIPEADIDESPAFGQNIKPEFIQGIGRVDGRFIIILKAGKVMDVQDLSRFGGSGAIKSISREERS